MEADPRVAVYRAKHRMLQVGGAAATIGSIAHLMHHPRSGATGRLKQGYLAAVAIVGAHSALRSTRKLNVLNTEWARNANQ